MMRWLFGRKSRWAGVDFSTLIPMAVVTAEKDPGTGLITVLQPRFYGGLLGRWVQPRLPAGKKYVKIGLEERGSFLWEWMDGRRTVADLAKEMLEAKPEEAEGIYDRTSAYMYQLECNKLIRFVNLET